MQEGGVGDKNAAAKGMFIMVTGTEDLCYNWKAVYKEVVRMSVLHGKQKEEKEKTAGKPAVI